MLTTQQEIGRRCLLVGVGLGGASVNLLRAVFHNALDEALVLELTQRGSSQRSTDLQTLGNNGRGDQLRGDNLEM